MKRTDTDAVLYPGCPIRNILSRFCDKWSLLVLHTLHCSGEAPLRFKELQRRIPDISQKMLTVTLRTLEEDGYVKRTVYAEVPPRVEYRLTDCNFHKECALLRAGKYNEALTELHRN